MHNVRLTVLLTVYLSMMIVLLAMHVVMLTQR
jgi:hypothetical protein